MSSTKCCINVRNPLTPITSRPSGLPFVWDLGISTHTNKLVGIMWRVLHGRKAVQLSISYLEELRVVVVLDMTLLHVPFSAVVPAGNIMNRGVVTSCPKGTYREGNALPTLQLNCTRCVRGWTTDGVASTTWADCDRTLPGFYSINGNQNNPPVEAIYCPTGWWANERPGGDNGGRCIECTSGWTTRNVTTDTDGRLIGATSSSACSECFIC